MSAAPKLKTPKKVNEKLQFTCFSCFKKAEMTADKPPKVHKDFKVAMCDPCFKYIQADDWTFTDGKSDYDVITGDGGEIISCDTPSCKNSFDTSLLKKWMEKNRTCNSPRRRRRPLQMFQMRPKTRKIPKISRTD